MPTWLRHLLAWAAIFTFALSAKVHLPFVQLAAWTVMAANYAELMPVDQAIHRAVSGDEFCGGCLYVRSAEHARAASDALVAKSFADGDPAAAPPVTATALVAVPPGSDRGFPRPNAESAPSRCDVPETPPPRA